MKPGQSKRCEACGCLMVGALTRDGKVAPIEVGPDERGTVLLFRAEPAGPLRATFGEEAVVQCRTFAAGSMAHVELVDQGVPLRLNHFAYCPDAARFARSGD